MEVVIFWFAMSVVVAIIAGNKGRSTLGWFLLAIIISPLLAGILVLALGRAGVDGQAQAFAAQELAITPETHARCPECRELVRIDARKCKHCGSALMPP